MISKTIYSNIFNILRGRYQPLCRIFPTIRYSSDDFKSENKTNSGGPETTSKRPSFGLRRKNLLPYPPIDVIDKLSLNNFLPSNFKTVKHGDYEFTECSEGFVHIYATAYKYKRDPKALAGYSVYYGSNHPLNISGPVNGRQDSSHSKLYAVLQCLKSIPKNLVYQVCICVDEIWVTTFLAENLPEISENSFRSVYTGKLANDLDTNMAINTLIRSRTDLKLRVKYVPIKIGFADMNFARNLAIDAAKEAERQQRFKIISRAIIDD